MANVLFFHNLTYNQSVNQTSNFLSLFIVVKREVIECCGILGRKVAGAVIIDMLDELEGVFVSVDQSEGVIFRIHCEELKKTQCQQNK